MDLEKAERIGSHSPDKIQSGDTMRGKNLLPMLIIMISLVSAVEESCSGKSPQEYQKDIFLKMPCCYEHEMGSVGPAGIGLDNQGHFCLMDTSTIFVYNDAGQVLRSIALHDNRGANIACTDFCFDNKGNIYCFLNKGFQANFYKFNARGDFQGEMTNDLNTVDDPRDRFLGTKIAFIPGYGLMLYGHRDVHIPVTFEKGIRADMILLAKKLDNFMIGKNSFVEIHYNKLGDITVELHRPNQEVKNIRISHDGPESIEPVYSQDERYQYYFIAKGNPDGHTFTMEITKYDGDRLIFSTGPLPINIFTYSEGKWFVVDNRGTIYYYAGDEGAIEILRWKLK